MATKTKTVKVPARKASTKKKKVLVCDFCPKEVPNHGSYGRKFRCDLCKRDICYDHGHYDPDDPSNYPNWYCKPCLNLWIPARREMQERHWQEEEELEKKIKARRK